MRPGKEFMQKHRLIGTVVFLFVVGSLYGQDILDGVVAVVGDKIILRSEVLQQAQMVAMQQRIGLNTDAFKALEKSVIDDLISQKVMLIKAEEDTITVDDQRVDEALNERIQMAVEQYGSVEKVEEYFGAPLNKIKRNYREEMKNSMIVQQVQGQKVRDVKISRAEVETFFQTMKDSLPPRDAGVKVRHILLEVKPGGAAYERGMSRMQEVQERLSQGASFESLTAEYSEDPGTARRGGDLGWIERGLFDEDFEEAAFKMEPGQVSKVVQTGLGLHLIKVDEKEETRVKVRHIFIRLTASEDDDAATLRRISAIRDRIMAGASFDSLALAYSDDPTTNLQGGDLGWLPTNQLQIEAFKAVVDTLKVGELSAPFKTQFGYHLVLKEAERAARPITLEEDYEDLKEYALRQKQERVLRAWIEGLKENIYIDVKDSVLE